MGSRPVTPCVEDILSRIDARRSFSSDSLALHEQGVAVVTDESIWKTLRTVDRLSLERMGLRLGVNLDEHSTANVVRSGNIIGSARVASEFGEVAINIEPKVASKRLVAIIDYMQGDACFSDELTEAYGGESDLLTLQVVRCLSLVLKTLSSGSIRGYRESTEDLCFVKGRADYCGLLSKPLPEIPARITCTFFEHSIDTEKNRVFRAALVKMAKFLSERDERLFELARVSAYSLSAVSDHKFTRSGIDRVARKHPRDAAALLACRDVLCDLSISPHPTHARPFFSYAINMATLFQDYVHRLMADALAPLGGRPVRSLLYRITGLDKEIELDGLFDRGEDRILVEAKYKAIESASESGRSDIYQTVAYCAHRKVTPSLAIMFYPVVSDDAPIRELGRLEGFDIRPRQVCIVAVNLSVSPHSAREAIGEMVARMLGE